MSKPKKLIQSIFQILATFTLFIVFSVGTVLILSSQSTTNAVPIVTATKGTIAQFVDPSLIELLIPPLQVTTAYTIFMPAIFQADDKRFGQVTDINGIDDQGFNQLAWEGMEAASEELEVKVDFLESQQESDYETNINKFMEQGYDGIITIGSLMADVTKATSEANPHIPFAIVDFPSQTSGDMGLLFAVDEPSFLAGYLAAEMSETKIVCTYGALQIPPVTQFMVGFERGVIYYNRQRGIDVVVAGWRTVPTVKGGGEGTFTGNFENINDGWNLAHYFFDLGCDIIFPVAGQVGLGSAAAAQDRGFTVIGIDVDMTQTNPDAAEVYLTSVLKKVDVVVEEAVTLMAEGTFEGGTDLVGTLENDGVGLAPFHDFEEDVSQEMRDELSTVEQGIIDGSISTEWPVGD